MKRLTTFPVTPPPPQATTTTAGITRYATLTEAHTGAAVDAAVTPPSLLMRRKANGAIIGGDFANWAVSHGSNSLQIAPSINALLVPSPNSVSIGNNAFAGSDNAVVVGSGSNADGYSAVAVGRNSGVPGDKAIAVGDTSVANASFAIAVGSEAFASGNNAIAVGSEALASGENAIAVGDSSGATGNNAIAVGDSSYVTANNGTAIGSTATVIASSAIQLGAGTNSTANTLQVFNYQLLESTGKIPPARYMVTPPATATSPGDPGQIAYDANYFYVCIATNTWRRAPLTTW